MTDENELEKKFKEDLERAQALSLESLALEKFRLQKLGEKCKRETGRYLSYDLFCWKALRIQTHSV